MDLWNIYDGEPWLDNPRLFMMNKRKRRTKPYRTPGGGPVRRWKLNTKGKKKMARRRRGRKAAAPRRKRRTRRIVMRSNPVRHYRRRRAHRSNRRRRYRRNPIGLAGLNLNELLKGAGAVILAPMLEKQLMPMLPASVTSTQYGRWAVRLGSAIGTWYLAKAAFGRRSADVVAIALGSSLIADAVQEFFPTLGLGAYAPVGLGAYPRRGLGLVTSGQNARGGLRGMRGLGPSANFNLGVTRQQPDAVFLPPF